MSSSSLDSSPAASGEMVDLRIVHGEQLPDQMLRYSRGGE